MPTFLGWFIIGIIASVVWNKFKKKPPKLMYVEQKKIEADEIKRIVKLFEEKYGKSEFKKLIGKDPTQLTLKELNNFDTYEANKNSLSGKLKNKIEDYDKYSKKKEQEAVAKLKKNFKSKFF